jgi:hypothetical protein
VKSAMLNAIVVWCSLVPTPPPPSPPLPPTSESSIPFYSQSKKPGSRLMGPLDVNMAFRPYSSCPLLSHFTLCTSTRALDLYLVIKRHGKSVLSIVLFLIVFYTTLSLCSVY